ncbi:MAG: hypothetical protein MUF06_18355 [Pirellulaceae bacterium]|jgi:hypothetical protein|nr:hypothetical protein [Pirellulaceae bacterium]
MTEKRRSITRRDLNKLTAAALGGLAAGALAGCRSEPAAAPAGGGSTTPVAANADVHLCRGLNDCKGKGKGGDNACRGQGACATAKEHGCGGQNECKGLGGCGETAGENECKGKGGCHVPLMEGAWTKLRTKVETEWKAKELEFGDAPAEAS